MTRIENISRWLRPEVAELRPPYESEVASNLVRLDQNANLFGSNPALAKIDIGDLAHYPSRDGDKLLAALAEWHGLAENNFVVGNGGQDLFDMIVRCFVVAGESIVTTAPGYPMFARVAATVGAAMVQVPLAAKFQLPVDKISAAEPKVVAVANPNNPTGNCFTEPDLLAVIAATDGIVLIDEAYIEYAGLGKSLLNRVDEFDNLLVMRTFSKAYGLAGLRVAYLAGNPELIDRLRSVRAPYSLASVAETVAVAALDEQEWVDQAVRSTSDERERLTAGGKKLGLRPHVSATNFVLFDCPVDPAIVVSRLKSAGILVRHFPGQSGLANAIRITVGLPEHTDAVLDALQDLSKW